MKLKNIFIVATASMGLLLGTTACSNQANSKPLNAAPIIAKSQKKAINNYHIKQRISYTIDSDTENITQDLTIGGDPLVARNIQSGLNSKVQLWMTDNYEYMSDGDGKIWFKTKLKNSLSNAKKLGQSMKNSNNVITANKSIIKHAKVKESGNNYIVTIKNSKKTNDAIIKAMVEAIKKTNNSNAAEVMKAMKIKKYTFTETIAKNNYQIKKVVSHGQFKVGDDMVIKIDQNMDHIGEYKNFKLPAKIEKTAHTINADKLKKYND